MLPLDGYRVTREPTGPSDDEPGWGLFSIIAGIIVVALVFGGVNLILGIIAFIGAYFIWGAILVGAFFGIRALFNLK